MRQGEAEAWAKWRGLIAEQGQSGLSVTAFCRERGLREGRLYAWKKRLREAEAGRFVAVRVRTTEEAAAVSRGGIEVRLRGGRSLVVEPGFDAQHLRALLSVLEGEA
jgi:transposase-like protein